MKIKNLFFLVVLSIITFHSHAMDTLVQLPSAQVLKRYFETRGLVFFAEDTGIHHFLGDAKLPPIIIAHVVDIYLYQYIQNIHSKIENKLPHIMTQLPSLHGIANITCVPQASASSSSQIIRFPRSIALDRLAILKSILQEAPKEYDALVDFEKMQKMLMNKRQGSQSKL